MISAARVGLPMSSLMRVTRAPSAVNTSRAALPAIRCTVGSMLAKPRSGDQAMRKSFTPRSSPARTLGAGSASAYPSRGS